MSGKKEKKQLKCKAKKKNPIENGQKKIPPEKAVFLSDEGRCTNGAKNEAYQNCRFPRRGKSRMAGTGRRIHSDRKNYSSTTVVQPYLSSQRPYWISCNLL